MPEYIVYRHGHNEANQSAAHGLPAQMAVLRLVADTPEEACRLARPQVTLFDNQYLSAELAAIVDEQEQNLNLKAEALEPGR